MSHTLTAKEKLDSIVCSSSMTQARAKYFNTLKGVSRTSIVWDSLITKSMHIDLTKKQAEALIEFGTLPYYSIELNRVVFDLQAGR
tara:strand:- start:222 stop:479 length:258 start_codon:yes stop_codon:yes gene_type:complete